MNLPYFPPTGPCSDRYVSFVELYIDGTGLCVHMLFLVFYSHLLGYLVSKLGDSQASWETFIVPWQITFLDI
jgi:hypothetical protein